MRDKSGRDQFEYDDSLTGFSEQEAASWDFKRTNGRNELTRRAPAVAGYRVLGDAPKEKLHRETVAPRQQKPAPKPAPRRNSYNSSVAMVSVDIPAPWDNYGQMSYLKMPVVGEVAAGRYDVTVAYHEPGFGPDADFVMLDAASVKINRNSFALRVRGQSMIDNEIEDGDIIIVTAQDWADDGDFVIACLTDSSDPAGFVTLKRFYRHKHSDRVVLQPANQQLSPIHILPRKGDARSEDLDGVKIQGRVTAIVKSASR